MKDTYLRPFWKSLIIYLTMVLAITAMCIILSLFVQGMVTEGGFKEAFFFIPENSRYNIPLWLFMGLAMGMLMGPILPAVMWRMFNLEKYARETWKLKLLPVYPGDEFAVMFAAHKTEEKEEPKWVKPFRFNTTLSIIGTNSFPAGHGSRTYQVFETDKGYRYQMSQGEFNRLAPEMESGKISGVFEWDISYRWPSIVKIGD